MSTLNTHRLPVAVIGAGRWGTIHARKLAELPGVEVCGVVDVDLLRARRLAMSLGGVPAVRAFAALPTRPAAAIVAVPLGALDEAARSVIAEGAHVLVEKPGAIRADALGELVSLARVKRVMLAVGYLERFNLALEGLPTTPRRLVARRAGPPRPAGGPLHLDWLVHDLDLACHLLGAELSVRCARSASGLVEVHLEGPRGQEARLIATHRAARARRRLWADGHVARLHTPGDPLAAQLAAFARGIRTGRWPSPLATGVEALRVLRLVEALEDRIQAAA